MRIVLKKHEWRRVYQAVCHLPEFGEEKALIKQYCQNELTDDKEVAVEFFESRAEKIRELGVISGFEEIIIASDAVILNSGMGERP